MKVLLVEDDPTTRLFLAHILQARGHDVSQHADAETALAACRRGVPPLVLLDWMLPGLDGLECCRRLRELPGGERSIVMVVTSRKASGDLKGVLDAGANDYVTKPVQPVDLAIRLAVAERLVESLAAKQAAQDGLRLSNRTLAERNAQLVDANREIEAFGYSALHDLQMHVRQVNSAAQLLHGTGAASRDDQAMGQAADILNAAHHMEALIDAVRTFSRARRQPLQRANVALDDLVRSILEQVQASTADRQIVWTVGPLPVVQGDAALLRQAMASLMDNAMKYTKPRQPATIEIGCAKDAPGEAVIFVRDNGVGFPAADAHKLFEPFQRLHDTREFAGSGMGLAHARRIVERHGGRTWAEGAEGQGASVYMSLPKYVAGP